MWYIVLKLIKHTCVITMNTRLSTGIITVFSLTLRSSVSLVTSYWLGRTIPNEHGGKNLYITVYSQSFWKTLWGEIAALKMILTQFYILSLVFLSVVFILSVICFSFCGYYIVCHFFFFCGYYIVCYLFFFQKNK
jgi:hypothetical protein